MLEEHWLQEIKARQHRRHVPIVGAPCAAPVFRSNISPAEMPVAVNDASNGETDPRLSQLLHRLDSALAGDGRLL